MKQLVVHSEAEWTQTALLEEGKLIEFAAERTREYGMAGSFYKGRIVNVLPGMQAAFVDIGLKKNAFLYIDDMLPAHLEKQPKAKPSIEQIARKGQQLLVQIMKEPLGGKGARVTMHYSLPGRRLVYMPEADYVAVSKKIEPESERTRLKLLGEHVRRPGEGIILRTVAGGEHEETIGEEMRRMRERWEEIRSKAEAAEASVELYRDLDLTQRLIRDVFDPETDQLVVDDPGQQERALSYLERTLPGVLPRVLLHREQTPVFEAYPVERQLHRDFGRKIWLPGGGYLVWDQTEALTVVDINTGKFTGADGSLETTVTDTNLEAAGEIARLLRLRDVGGIVIIDFIDMQEDGNRSRVLNRLEERLHKDRTQSHVVGWTKLGLLELTRKKVRESGAGLFYRICGTCGGSGQIMIR
ncbi:Rne/Rng family ribonuclease [Saccharibacillus sp. CPCC 101409]|uniref:Rne/Rng family ribonuclease n=1 Tax=Saccharibacillus sp. CPCC 101409 TaxID=3058041 RepID=UPI00267180B2|nr:Rne/Rng family ribonuclease [Saccharibacillus sp. CPCC 101409]MDO3410177.1 Rne/Rng family ribonuclease [Saccharibacillus sp. CPCC 101409]